MNKLIKKIKFSFLYILILGVVAFGFVSSQNLSGKQKVFASENNTSYYETIDKLAQTVSFSADFESFYEENQPTTLYNFLVLTGFQGDADILNTQIQGQGYTYRQAIEEMFNSEINYSVKQYYKTVSGGLLNLETVIVGNETFILDSPRTKYTSKYKTSDGAVVYQNGVPVSSGNSNGYDPRQTAWNIVEQKGVSSFIKDAQLEYLLKQLPITYLLEYELLGDIYSHVIDDTINTYEYGSLSDSNDDGRIDSLSIILTPDISNLFVGWSDLLWPHASQVQKEILEMVEENRYQQIPFFGTIDVINYIFDIDIKLDDFKYTYQGKEVFAGNYMMSNDFQDIEINARTGYPTNNTAIHELGHVLGWPDYYIYEQEMFGETTPNVDPVDIWDIMENSHQASAQYPTAYSRSVQNWLQEGLHIQEITQNGEYSLKPVNYEEVNGIKGFDRTVAYKIVNPNNPNQSIWFEYRNQNSSSFDYNIKAQSGLIAYLVDEGFGDVDIEGQTMGILKNPGNFAAAPYNLFVFRPKITTSEIDYWMTPYSPLNETLRSFGDNEIYYYLGNSLRTPNLTWQEYDYPVGTAQNHIPASEVEMVDSGIVIRYININAQGELVFEVEWDQFAENIDYIERSEFEDQNLYDALLAFVGKTNTDKLEPTDFVEFDLISLSNKNITSLKGFELFEFKKDVFIDLSNNNLSTIGNFLQVLGDGEVNLVLNLAFNYLSSTSEISQMKSSSGQIIIAMQKPNTPTFAYSANNLQSNKTIIYYNDYLQYYDLMQTYTLPLTNGQNTLSNAGSFNFEFMSKGVNQLSSFTINVNVIKINLLENSKIFEVDDSFDLTEIIGLENSTWQEVLFSLLDSSDNVLDLSKVTTTLGQKSLKVVFDNLGVTIAFDIEVKDTQAPVVTVLGSQTIYMLKGSTLNPPLIVITDNYDKTGLIWETDSDLENLELGENVLQIYAVDSSGNKSAIVEINVIIIDIILNSDLYIEVNQGFDYETAYTFLPEEYKNQFIVASETQIDSSKLGLQDFSLTFTNKDNVQEKFVLNGQVYVKDLQAPTITLVGKDTIFIFKGEEFTVDEFVLQNIEIYDNYDENLSAKTNNTVSTSMVGLQELSIFAEDSSGNLSSVIVISVIVVEVSLVTDVVINLNETVNYQNLYNFLPITYFEEFAFETLIEADTSIIGGRPYAIRVYNKADNTISKTLNGIVQVRDIEAPTITLLESESDTIFVFKGQSFDLPRVKIEDNYSENLTPKTNKTISTLTEGLQTLEMFAEDSSGNRSSSIVIYVIVVEAKPVSGTVLNLNSEVDYKTLITFTPIEYIEYFEFEILNPIDEAKIGNSTFSVRVFNIENNSISKTINGIVQVRDIEAPTISFVGGIKEVYIYLGDSFVRPEVEVSDNYDTKESIRLTGPFGVVKTYEIGIYYLTYRAKDSSGNESKDLSLKVTVLPRPIENLEVIKVSRLKIVTPNTSITFNVNAKLEDLKKNRGPIKFAWYVNGILEEVIMDELSFTYKFKEMGTYNIEVRAENTDLSGNKMYASTAQILEIVVDEGGILDKYSLIIIGVVATTLIGVLIGSAIIRKKRRMF